MKRNTQTINVNGSKINDFEFIVGPMGGISIPQPPKPPEEFIIGAYNGGGTPITGISHLDPDLYIEDLKKVKLKMGDRYFGANILATWTCASEFIKKFSSLNSDQSPSFLDINAVEVNFEGILPLLKDIDESRLIYIGFSMPISLYTFKNYLKQKEYAFLLDRIQSGTLKINIPNNYGGGHLPIFKKEQEKIEWADELLKEIANIEKELNVSIPFIVEKGMMTIEDFTKTILKYSNYPNFSGVRFASNLELTNESGLNDDTKMLISNIVQNREKDMIVPILGCTGAKKFKNGTKVRGGIISWVVATPLAQKIHHMQCDGEDFPKFNRPYNSDIFKEQMKNLKDKTMYCHLCLKEACPKEYCEIRGAFEGVSSEGKIENVIITISPKIIDLDPKYVKAPVSFVVQDIIEKTISKLAIV